MSKKWAIPVDVLADVAEYGQVLKELARLGKARDTYLAGELTVHHVGFVVGKLQFADGGVDFVIGGENTDGCGRCGWGSSDEDS